MKHVKKLIVAALTLVMALAVATPAFAASITVNQDSSYTNNGVAGQAGRKYSYYKIFSAVKGTGADDTFTGGHDADGNPVTSQGDDKVSYTATAAVAAKLADAGNLWFDVKDIAGSTNKSVSWKQDIEPTAANVQAAAAWLIENGAYESGPTELTFANGKWTSGTVDEGYYVISGDTGKNLAAVTTDIEINEKNDYPPISKTQADADDFAANAEQYATDEEGVKIGDVLKYKVTVKVPAAAEVDETIEVYDKITQGLDYNNDLVVTLEGSEDPVTLADGTEFDGSVWDKVITVTAANKGKTYTFSYSMTVNSKALVDTGRENEAGLKYGDEYNSIPQKVNYTTYFTGIEKVDGSDKTKKLANVTFTLKEGDTELKVKKDGAYYIPDATGTSEVVTDSEGKIIIRGLDNDKTYTLTETATNAGYNLLEGPVTLVLTKDEGEAYTTTTFPQIENNQGTVLPSTGGIGTTIFYVVGGTMVVAAIVMMVTKRRMAKIEG